MSLLLSKQPLGALAYSPLPVSPNVLLLMHLDTNIEQLVPLVLACPRMSFP